MNETADLFELAGSWHRNGRAVALATLVQTWGSSPRTVGARMIIDEDCRIEGSVSGGCVEAAVAEAALQVIASGAPRLLDFRVSDGEAWSVGLACGGRVAVFVECLTDASLALLDHTLAARAEGRSVALVTDLDAGLSFVADGLTTRHVGGIPSGSLREAAGWAVERDRAGRSDAGNSNAFIDIVGPAWRLLIVGAVHIAQALVPLARVAGYEPIVIDPRPAFATAERFPGVRLIDDWPDGAVRALRPDQHTGVVVMSHDPKLDDPALLAAFKTQAFYVGALGSRKTHASRLERLAGLGASADMLARIHGPVGLAIGSLTPGEIATSILAEMIAVRRQPERRSSANRNTGGTGR